MPAQWPFWRLLIILLLLSSLGGWGAFWYSQRYTPLSPIVAGKSSNNGAAKPSVETSETTELEADVVALTSRVASLEGTLSSPVIQTPITTKAATTKQTPREYYVYVGSGSTTSREWTDLTGTTVAIDTNFYDPIQSVTFEAALSILGGEARARLVNQTTGAILASTEVFHNTSTSLWKSSSPFSLQTGNNTYLVQLRSSSGEKAQLDGARIKIIVK